MIRALLALMLLLAGAPAAAQAGNGGSNINAQVNVRVLKPLQLTALRNLDFGTIVMRPFTALQTVSVTTAGRTCGSGGQLTCSGAFTTARFRVTGANREVVMIRTPSPTITLSNAAGNRLTLTPVHPQSVVMPNSGNQGIVFEVGGQLQIPPDAADGLYSGILDIQVAYQ